MPKDPNDLISRIREYAVFLDQNLKVFAEAIESGRAGKPGSATYRTAQDMWTGLYLSKNALYMLVPEIREQKPEPSTESNQ